MSFEQGEHAVELTVLMPCLNEALTLPRCIEAARSFFERAGVVGEVVVADNGSTDGSRELARAKGARVVEVAERGYGAALYQGAVAAHGHFVIMGDSDASYDFGHLELFMAELRGGADLVMGNRFRGGILPGAMPLKNRYLGNPVLSGIGRLLFSTGIGDFHCGLRGFRRDAFLRMDLQTTGMEFASEMVIKASLLGLRLTEVPTRLHPDGRGRPPHLRPWRDGWRHLRFMLLFSPRWLFLYPGLALMLIGALVGVLVLVGALSFGFFGLGVHTLAFASAAVIVGYQAASFWLMARVFGREVGLIPSGREISENALEYGLLAGGILFLAGLVAGASALYDWGQTGFGALDANRMMRLVTPAITAMALGAQTTLLAWFLGVLRLRRRPPSVDGVREP